MQHQYTQKDYFKTLIRRYAGEIENVPDEIVLNIKSIIETQHLEINHSNVKHILRDLRLQKYYSDIPYILYRLTGKRMIISEEKKAALLHMFEYNSNIQSTTTNKFNVEYYIKTKLFYIGIRKVQTLYYNRCARILQRTWDRYWYQPNKTGESRAALAGYCNFPTVGK